MSRTRWIIFAIACVLLLGILVANSKKNDVNVSNVDPAKIITSGDTADHVYGNKDSKVVLMEYGDFQCPGCGAAYPELKSIKEAYKDKIAFVFRNFPLTTLHPNALAAATTAGAAAKQGKFWEMHNLLYESQKSWENLTISDRGDAFIGYAKQLGLNVDTFKQDMSSQAVASKISSDRALGAKQNVNSTPSLFLNGKLVPNNIVTGVIQGDGKLLKAELDKAIQESGGTPPSATN
jgi:protein-disulfide isomerase